MWFSHWGLETKQEMFSGSTMVPQHHANFVSKNLLEDMTTVFLEQLLMFMLQKFTITAEIYLEI
jgi:hypothetical protein